MMLVLLCFITCAAASVTQDYFWRDYYGQIPSDAFPAGLDRNGHHIYIGQALYENKLIPGKILQNDSNIYFEWAAKEIKQTENVKIFCSGQPQKLEWTAADRQNLFQLSKRIEIVNGGYEPNFLTFLGRVLTDGETLVGKVACNQSNCYGLYTTKNGRTKEHSSFFVLTHNPKKENVNNCTCPIDVRFETH